MRLSVKMFRILVSGLTLALLGILALVSQGSRTVVAQDEIVSGEYAWQPGTQDLSQSFKDKTISIKTGLADKDEFRYRCSLDGAATVASGDITSDSAGSSFVEVVIKLASRKDASEFDAELRYNVMQIEQRLGGDTWSMVSERGDENSTNEVFRNGEKVADGRIFGLPNAASVKNGMGEPVAFGTITKRGLFTSAAHRMNLGDSKTFDAKGAYVLDVPARLIDPLVFARMLFSGVAGTEVRLDEVTSIRVPLSFNAAGSVPVGYSLMLTLRKVFGDKDVARSGQFEVTVRPVDGATIEVRGTKVAAPSLSGTMTVDFLKGVIGCVSLRGEYDSRVGEVSVKGSIQVRMDLAHKKDK